MKAEHILAAAWRDLVSLASSAWVELDRKQDRPGICAGCGGRVDPPLTECLPCLADRPW